MIKVCHIVDALNMGGLEKTIIEIVRGLKGYAHQVWCLKEKGLLADELKDAGIRVRAFGYSGALNLFSLFDLNRELKKEAFQIVHCHGLYPSIWGRLAAIFAGVAVSIVHCQNLYYGIAWKERIKLRLLSYKTSRIIAVSEAVKECLVKFVGVPAGRIEVIYNSAADINRQFLIGKRAQIRQELGFWESDFLAGAIGRLQGHKGHIYLLEAIAKCRREGVDCKCVIAGEGPERPRLEAKIKELGLAGQVRLLGLRKDIEDILLSLDVLVQPSVIREGLPLVLAEGASAGLALIATAVGGNPEIVNDGVNGFLVPQRDAVILAGKIKSLSKNPSELKRMGEASRGIWQEKFNSEIMLKRVDGLYRRLISDERGLLDKRRERKACLGFLKETNR